MATAICARHMWRPLLRIFERDTFLNQLTARRKLYTATMTELEGLWTLTNRSGHVGS